MESRQELDMIEPLARTAGAAGLVSGATGLVSLVVVLGGEALVGADFMSTRLATVAAWLAFASAVLLVLAISGLLTTMATTAGVAASRSVWAMQLAASVMVGAAATLPLVVVGIVDRAPGIVAAPPAAVPATFIASGLALGAAGIWTAVLLRRSLVVPGWITNLLIVASVVAIVPLPSRHFPLAFAVAAILRTMQQARHAEDEVGALAH